MAISDLLTQISGDRATNSSTSTVTVPPSVYARTKRKAEDSLRYDVTASTPRENSLSSTKSIRFPEKAYSAISKSQLTLKKASKRFEPPTNNKSTSSSFTSRTSVITPQPLKTTSASEIRKPPPKKSSFAEILARGQRAQAVMGQVGKIQHKKVEKLPTRVKDDGAATGRKRKVTATSYTGTARPVSKNGSKEGTQLKRQPNPTKARSSNSDTLRRTCEEEPAPKKFKKAAIATTGYTGTARPKPMAPSQKDASRGGALLNASRSRFGIAKSSRYKDDYDEELDDFIEYDDEKQDIEGPSYDYASDASSDMEAGLNELDYEERRAEYIGIKEDSEQDRLERSLKAMKEERKRKALAGLRGAKRS